MVTFLSMPLNLTFLPFLCSLSLCFRKNKNKKKTFHYQKSKSLSSDLVLRPLQGFQLHLNPHCCSPCFFPWYVFLNTSTGEQLHVHVTFLTIAHPCHCPSPTPFIWGSPLLLEMKSRDYLIIMLFMGFSRQEYWSGLPFRFPVDHVLSELSTMTCLTWVALRGMAQFHWVGQDCGPCDQNG